MGGWGKEGAYIMYNFNYVSKKQCRYVREDLEKLIHLVQDEVRRNFTFSYRFVGSAARNMITVDKTTNTGFDFDVNLCVNDTGELSPKEIRQILMQAFNKHGKNFKYESAEDEKRVFTIKVIDHKNSRIIRSCDFAIVNDYTDEYGEWRQEYIFFNRKQNKYEWKEQSEKFYDLPIKEEWIRDNGLWNFVRGIYLDKKNKNLDANKKSRSLYAEAVNEVYEMNKETECEDRENALNKVSGWYNINIW